MNKMVEGIRDKFDVLNEMKLLNSLPEKKIAILDNIIAE
jgi:hypothetical protein